MSILVCCLKGLLHPSYLTRAVSCYAFVVVAIFMAHEDGDKNDQPSRPFIDEHGSLCFEVRRFHLHWMSQNSLHILWAVK